MGVAHEAVLYNNFDQSRTAIVGFPVALEDKFERLERLVELGKERGYVLYEEVSAVLQADLNGNGDLEDVLAGLDGAPPEALDEQKEFAKKTEDGDELLDLEVFAPGTGEKITDPVRMYLREMGTVPLLTREGEIEIARRIERGQNSVLKSLSRTPLIIQEFVRLAEEIRGGAVVSRDIILISDPIVTDEILEEKKVEFLAVAEDVMRVYRRVLQIRQKLQAVPRATKPKQYKRLLWDQ